MKTRLRGARLFLTILPTYAYACVELHRLERLAAQGAPVDGPLTRLHQRVKAAVARIEREAA